MKLNPNDSQDEDDSLPNKRIQQLVQAQKEREEQFREQNKPPVELEKLTKDEKKRLTKHPMYQELTSQYDVEDQFEQWFGNFDKLEKDDVWKKLPDRDKALAAMVEQDRIQGIVRPETQRMAAFDDPTDEDNMNYLAQNLRTMSKPQPPPSENSMSSGSGNYQEEADKIDLSSDEDLAKIKVLTSERNTKQQVQIDLDRMKKHETVGRSIHGNSDQRVEMKKVEKPDHLPPEKLAISATLASGRIDLYKRALQISQKQAKQIIAINQGEKAEHKIEDDILSQITEDEEFNTELKNIAAGEFNLSVPKNIKAFDPEASYFSEDEEEVENDDITKWQKETHDDKFTKGSFLTPTEAWLQNSSYVTRETKKANMIPLRALSTRVEKKAYNAKDIMKRMKKAGLRQSLEVEVAQKQIDQLEREQSRHELIANSLTNKTEDGKDKYTEKNRLFKRNLEEGKLYTDRYVQRLKVAHAKLMDKFTLGSKYALRAQKKQIMSRATRLVVDSHDKLLESFQEQAMTLLHQTLSYKDELEEKTAYCEHLLKHNRSLEIDMSMILRQNDYIEERVPKMMKTFEGYRRQDITGMEAMDSEFAISVAENESCSLPSQLDVPVSNRFVWEELTLENRCRRANQRQHIVCDLEAMEPTMTSHAFDFYGTYARISETQKFKYAETTLIRFYRALVQEVLASNENLKSEIQNMLDINKKYEINEEDVKEAIRKEKEKRSQLQQTMDTQKELYESKLSELIGSRHEEKLDITDFYTKQINFLNAELDTSKKIREILQKNNEKLKQEIQTLAKVVRTSRNHFKELEKCDLEALNAQLNKYESKIAKLQASESSVETIRASKAKGRLIESQKKANRDQYNDMAKKHRFTELGKPIEEKAPKVALKDLWEEKRPKKIHERLPGPERGTNIEDVLVEKRQQALQYLDASEAKSKKQQALNEDSLTEPSVQIVSSDQIFETAKLSQEFEQSSSIIESASIGERLRIKIRDNNSGKDGYEPFKSSKQDIESEKSMLLGSGTDDINNYLLGKLGSSNQDLIEHDQILISENGFDKKISSKKEKMRFNKRDPIQIASHSNSQQSYEPNQRSRTQLKSMKLPTMIVTEETQSIQAAPIQSRPKPWQRKDIVGDQMKANLEQSIQQQSKQSYARGKTADRFTITADSSKNTTHRMLNTTTPNSGRLKNFSIDDDSFGQDSFTRLQTANHLVGLPRRDPIKHKVIPKMQGVMGGDQAQQALVTMDSIVQASTQVPTQRKLPKLNDVAFSRNMGKRRAASIPPKTASTPAYNANQSLSSNQQVLQSLVNNNAFLGRGKFNNRGHSIAITPNSNQPMSPPSISVKGSPANMIQHVPAQQSRGSKVHVKLPGTMTAGLAKRHSKQKDMPPRTMELNEIANFDLKLKEISPKSKKPSLNRRETMEMAAELNMVMDDAAFTISKLNLPSSAGIEDDDATQTIHQESRVGGLQVTETSFIDLPAQDQKDKDDDSNNSTSQNRAVFSRLEGSLVPRIENPTGMTLEDESQSQSKMSSQLRHIMASKELTTEDSIQSSKETRQFLSMTPLTTIEIRTDTIQSKSPQKGARQQQQTGKNAQDKAGGPGAFASSKSPGRKKPQPLKKNKTKLVTPAKNQERIEKEKRQNKLKSQLENAIPAESPERNQ